MYTSRGEIVEAIHFERFISIYTHRSMFWNRFSPEQQVQNVSVGVMKKSAIVIGMILLLAAVVPAMAAPAVVIRGDQCDILDADQVPYITTGSVKVQTYGNFEVIMCTGKLPSTAALPPRAIMWNHITTGGGMCGTNAGITERWWQILTPSGEATVICQHQID